MIRALYYSHDGILHKQIEVADFPTVLEDKEGLLWVDFEGTPPQEDEVILREVFGFHPLAIDDALQESHVPKVDDWGEYLYIVVHAISFDREKDIHLDTLEVDVFLGKNYMVTHHDQPVPALDHTWDIIQRDERNWKVGMDHLLYRLTDEMVASYMPVVEEIDDEIDQTEDRIFGRPTGETLERIFMLKRAVLHMRRIIGPQREVLNKLARDDYAVVDTRDRVYFRDVYDHLVRMYDINESLRDLVSGTLDTYLSVINNRMNDIMKTLTTITTLFMPVSFLVGFFGMNYFVAPDPLYEWVTRPSFFFVLVLMGGTMLFMFLWMRSRRWL